MNTKKSQWLKFMSRAHFNNLNVGLYSNSNGACLKAENIVNGQGIGIRQFPSIEAAEEWYEAIPGSGPGRLLNAIERLAE